MSDLIAIGALFAAGGCSGGKVLLPFREWRIDAVGPGPKGVPRPEQTLDNHEAAFVRQGLNREEMIGLVACSRQMAVFSIRWRQVHSSNGRFKRFLQNLLETMINTVTKGVTLGKLNDIFPIKPSSLYAALGGGPGKMVFSSFVRLISRNNSWDADPGRTVKIHIRFRSGKPCSEVTSCITIQATEFSWSRSLYHQGGYPYFKKYKFSQEVSTEEGISGFDVEVIDTAADGSVNTAIHTNGGKGFPFDDLVLTQPHLTCNGQKDPSIFNLTAVRADGGLNKVQANFQLPPTSRRSPTEHLNIFD